MQNRKRRNGAIHCRATRMQDFQNHRRGSHMDSTREEFALAADAGRIRSRFSESNPDVVYTVIDNHAKTGQQRKMVTVGNHGRYPLWVPRYTGRITRVTHGLRLVHRTDS
ncbi:MAG: hypothetical protein R2744_02550 [Bacteroidales bacterium]